MAKRELYSSVNPFRVAVDYEPAIDEKTGELLPGMCRQEFMEECDVNAIMARYEKAGGSWPPPMPGEPMYYDFTSVPGNLMDAMQQMYDAEDAFMRLSATVRKEFDNDPLRFVEYAADRANLEQLRKWGLAEPEKAPEKPIQVEVVDRGPPPGNAPQPAPPAPHTVVP